MSKCTWFDVKLLTENVDAWEIFRRVHGQELGTGVLNILAVYETMDRMDIPKNEQLEMVDYILMIETKLKERLNIKEMK